MKSNKYKFRPFSQKNDRIFGEVVVWLFLVLYYEFENEDIVDEYIVLDNYDNIDNLWSWYNCYDDFNWVMYDEV